MGLYDDLDKGKPRPTSAVVRNPEPSKPMAQGPWDTIKALSTGFKDLALPFAINAAQPLTAGYRDELAAKLSGRDPKEVKDRVSEYMAGHSNKLIDILGHTAGGTIGDVGTGIVGKAAAPSVFARPGATGGAISGGAIGTIGGIRDAWQDLISGDADRTKKGIGDILISTAGGIGGGAAAEAVAPFITWGGRVARSRMTPIGREELNRLNFAAADAQSKGWRANLAELMRLTNSGDLKHEVAPRLEGIMASGAKGQPGIGTVTKGRVPASADLDRPATGPARAEWESRTSGPNNLYSSAEEATREAARAQRAASRVYGDNTPVYSTTPLPPSVERLRSQVAKETTEGLPGVPPPGTPMRAKSVIDTAIARETDPQIQRQARDVLAGHHRRLADEARAMNKLDDTGRHLDAIENRPMTDMSLPQFSLQLPGGSPLLRLSVDQIPGVQAANRRAANMLSTDPIRAAKQVGRGSAYTPAGAALGHMLPQRYLDLIYGDER